MEEQLSELAGYKVWAEAKIALLLQRLRETERQRREEASRAAGEAAQLRKVGVGLAHGLGMCSENKVSCGRGRHHA